jgi:hypothetical protein
VHRSNDHLNASLTLVVTRFAVRCSSTVIEADRQPFITPGRCRLIETRAARADVVASNDLEATSVEAIDGLVRPIVRLQPGPHRRLHSNHLLLSTGRVISKSLGQVSITSTRILNITIIIMLSIHYKIKSKNRQNVRLHSSVTGDAFFAHFRLRIGRQWQQKGLDCRRHFAWRHFPGASKR